MKSSKILKIHQIPKNISKSKFPKTHKNSPEPITKILTEFLCLNTRPTWRRSNIFTKNKTRLTLYQKRHVVALTQTIVCRFGALVVIFGHSGLSVQSATSRKNKLMFLSFCSLKTMTFKNDLLLCFLIRKNPLCLWFFLVIFEIFDQNHNLNWRPPFAHQCLPLHIWPFVHWKGLCSLLLLFIVYCQNFCAGGGVPLLGSGAIPDNTFFHKTLVILDYQGRCFQGIFSGKVPFLILKFVWGIVVDD